MAGAGAPRLFVSAGEPSGDHHAAEVVRAVRRRWPEATVDAFGGPALRQAGATVRFPMEDYTVLGLVEALGKLGPHLRLLRTLRGDFRRGRYDAVLLVDYPGFNLRLAEAARAAGLRTLYYVAPQLWAWRPGRARRLRRAVDRLAVVLPFEPAFFARHGLEAVFVGHPLRERAWPDRARARERLGIGPDARVLGLFPGSRGQEVRRLWPDFRDAARRLLRAGTCDVVAVAATAGTEYPGAEGLGLHVGAADAVLGAADAALVKSGTSTLEAACAGTPMVVAYRVHRGTWWMARRLVTVPWVSLVNLVAGRGAVPEVLQDRVTPERLADTVAPLLAAGSPEAARQRADLVTVRDALGGPGAAERVTDLLGPLLAS